MPIRNEPMRWAFSVALVSLPHLPSARELLLGDGVAWRSPEFFLRLATVEHPDGS